jgi:hypothetical protein
MTPGPDEDATPQDGTRGDQFAVSPIMSQGESSAADQVKSTESSGGPSPDAVEPGQVLLGQYLVKRKLGQGGWEASGWSRTRSSGPIGR